MFLWGCNFIYRPGVPAIQDDQCNSDTNDSKCKESDNIVHYSFYVHDIRFVIMGYL